MQVRHILALTAAACLAVPLTVIFADQAGPNKSSSETVARPKRGSSTNGASAGEPVKDDDEKVPSRFRRDPADLSEDDATFRSDVITVNVDAAVLDNKGRFIPGIPAGNFRILEDKVPQKITGFSMGEAPMTVALVVEFSNLWQSYYSQAWYETLVAAHGFVETLKPEDYLAIVAFDIRPEILSDFSTNRQDAQEALRRLNFAAYSESNLFDALTDTADRMSEIEGRKAIVVVASGQDTFSKINFGETRKRLQRAGVPVYAISIGQTFRLLAESYNAVGPITRMDWLMADNQLRTFANETGGQAFYPRFIGEFPTIFQNVQQALRNQYSLAYQPANQERDGQFREIKVELVNPEGQPLKITSDGKAIKYSIVAKRGYTAPRSVE
jgi:VWFA-related protein